jgi:hydrocephalus-inducing protein
MACFAGDVGFKYSWQTQKLLPHMSLSPMNGYLAPGQHVKVQVTFHPRSAAADIRVDNVPCSIEGMHDPPQLSLSGSASESAHVEATMQFKCRVRESTSQDIVLKNPSWQHWTLKPKIDHPMWSGKELVMVPAYETVKYTLVYQPLTKTKEGQTHRGTVFFPIPDGTGLLYMLEGNSLDPAPIAVLQRYASTPHSIVGSFQGP